MGGYCFGCGAPQGTVRHIEGCPGVLGRLAKYLMTDWGFKLNPYDQCVANKIINGSQCTIVWHVDGLKISHMQEEVVNDMVKK